jgi:hypothetical protein
MKYPKTPPMITIEATAKLRSIAFFFSKPP